MRVMAKRQRTSDLQQEYLEVLETMTAEERERVRRILSENVVLTQRNAALLGALREYDSRCRVTREMPVRFRQRRHGTG